MRARRSIFTTAIVGLVLSLFSSGMAEAAVPASSVAPTITGSVVVGQTLTSTVGTWSGSPTSYTYQWFRCSSLDGTTCNLIAGATASTFTTTSADVGFYIKLSVTALNGEGGTTSFSAPTNPILQVASATTIPVISGDTQRGGTLSTTNGVWNVTPAALSYQWQRCQSTDVSSCSNITGAIASSYMSVNADIGFGIRAIVTAPATFYYAVGTSASLITSPISSVPVATSVPSFAGNTYVGETIKAVAPTYAAYPAATMSYQWQRCSSTDLTSCTNIANESTTSYTITATDLSSYLRFTTTIQNVLGGSIVSSPLSAVVIAVKAPTNVVTPTLTGYPTVQYSLQVEEGTWQGIPTPTFTYQWQKCSSQEGKDCTDISGATAKSYTLKFAEAGAFVRAKVTATNRVGSLIAYSNASPSISTYATFVAAPTVLGFMIVGIEVQGVSGVWSGVNPANFKYQWQRCSKKDGSDCVDIAGATKLTYLLVDEDEGKYVRIKQWIPDETFPAYSLIAGDPIFPSLAKQSAMPAKPTPAPVVTKPVVKATTITCIKGKLVKKVTAVNPKCPTGYKKK